MALTMKWYSRTREMSRARFQVMWGALETASVDMARARVRVAVVMVRRWVRRTDHDEPPVRGAQHLDGHAVQRAQRLGGDNLLDRALDRAAGREIDDAVDVGQQR